MNIEIRKGEQIPIEMELLNENGDVITPSQLTEITMTCRKLPIEQSPILFQKKLSDSEPQITFDSEEGKYIIDLLEADTKDLQYGTYGFDIKVESNNLIEKFVGSLVVKEEYTMGYDNEQD